MHMRLNYSDYRYFGVSALGAEPDYETYNVAPGGVQPHRVEDPVLWLLSKAGTVPIGMTADTFDRLLYTDCRAGHRAAARAAVSRSRPSPTGWTPPRRSMAVGWLLYEAQNAWIVQRRPVEDFPLGLRARPRRGYGTAPEPVRRQGVDRRPQGNHLADCLLTRDADRYGPTRPAQLWRSDLWRGRALATAPTARRSSGELCPGPLTVDAVADWAAQAARAAAGAEPTAHRARGAGGRRVMIVSDGPDEAMTWIAAATLLMPMRQALDGLVQGVHRRSRPRPAPDHRGPPGAVPAAGAGPGRVVVRAGRRTSAPRTRTRSASGPRSSPASSPPVDDPYDVVDAVELAETLGGDAPRTAATRC